MNSSVVSRVKESLQIDSAAVTDRGQKREVNQDSIFHQTGRSEAGEITGLFLVCDGMGGHQAGEIASRIAVDTITTALSPIVSGLDLAAYQHKTRPSYLTLRQYVEAAVSQANHNIRQYADQHLAEAATMGTTVTLVLIRDRLAHIANVGDGRVYAWREGHLSQITRDHSLAAKLAEMGVIDKVDIARHPHSNLIYRSLGSDPEVEVDIFEWELRAGDKLLLCSDGLWKAFGALSELAYELRRQVTPTDLCRQLVNQAKYRDGSDNISGVVVEIKEK
jgi:serine/threonine protein phosphatase PrpC